MEPVLRAAFMYFFLLVIVRLAGKRTLAEVTPFDFVLLLIIGEATQQSITGEDFSVTNSVVIVTTLVTLDIAFSLIKQRLTRLDRFIEGVPTIIIRDGVALKETMNRLRVDEADVLEAGRKLRGIERLDQIKYAILEKDGGITIVPKDGVTPPSP